MNDDEVVVFAEGALSGARLARLESHLDTCSTCHQLINAVARALDTVRGSSTLGGYSSLLAPGSVIANRYRIDRFLARGGMGEVYEAFDQELGERVALKSVVSTACDNPRAERKLKGEVQLARRISHPNVCRIYDLGVHEPSGSRPRVRFLTMELIDGESLAQRLDAGPLPIAEASAIARQLLSGLAAAHEAGVLLDLDGDDRDSHDLDDRDSAHSPAGARAPSRAAGGHAGSHRHRTGCRPGAAAASAPPVVKALASAPAPAQESAPHPSAPARAARDRLLNPFEAPQ